MQSLPGYDAWLESPYQQYHTSDYRYNELVAELETMNVYEVERLDNAIAEAMFPAWDKMELHDEEAKDAYYNMKWPEFLLSWDPSKEEMGALERAIDWWADKIIEDEEEEQIDVSY